MFFFLSFKVDGRNFFDRPVKNDLKVYDIIKKNTTCQGDDSKSGCLLDYRYFKNYYKLITINLSKQQKLDADPKTTQKIDFTRNLNRNEGATMFFTTEEAKETVLYFSKGILKVLWFYLVLIKY